MLLAGFDVYTGHFEILAIVIVGVAGDLVGASIAYAVGYFGRIEILHQHGRKIHLTPERLERAEHWFARYGSIAVPVCRDPAAGPRVHVVPGRRRADALRPLPRPERAGRRAVDHLLGRARPGARAPTTTRSRATCTTSTSSAVVLIVGGIGWPVCAGVGGRSPPEAPLARAPPGAIALGLIHGPPSSRPSRPRRTRRSSRGCAAGDLDELEPAGRKRFEVALHAGAAAARCRAPRRSPAAPRRSRSPALPPALAGVVAARVRSSGGSGRRRRSPPASRRSAAAMGLAERRPRRPRATANAGVATALALGGAQALALIPGVSRSGAARGRGPVARVRTARGAGALGRRRAADHRWRPSPPKGREALRERGAVASSRRERPPRSLSTLASVRAGRARAEGGSLRPFAVYRIALAAAVVRRLRQNGRAMSDDAYAAPASTAARPTAACGRSSTCSRAIDTGRPSRSRLSAAGTTRACSRSLRDWARALDRRRRLEADPRRADRGCSTRSGSTASR